MAPYALDLRERVAAAVDFREGSQRQIARRFRVRLSVIVRRLQRRRPTGTWAPQPHGGGPKPAVSRSDQQRLGRLVRQQDEAAKQQAQSKTEVLSKNLQAKFNELQALIDRYLDDDVFTTYTEALEHKRAERGEAAKPRPKATQPTSSAPAPSPAEPVVRSRKPAATPNDAPPY